MDICSVRYISRLTLPESIQKASFLVLVGLAKFWPKNYPRVMDKTPGHHCKKHSTHFHALKMKNIARACFAMNRQTGYAVMFLSLTFLSRAYGSAAQDNTVVHLAGTETITGAKTDTNNWTFSDPTKTLLLGATSIPNLSSTMAGAQQLIFTTPSNSHWPFAVVSGYRNGVSGERYYSGFAPDGHFQTNQYMGLVGNYTGASETGGSMLSIWADVPVALSISNGVANNAHGGMLISGWGNFTHEGMWPRVFTVSSQGTTTIINPYGEAYYTRPQFVLGDIGTNSASPAWTYSSFHQHNGHLKIGSFDGANTEGGEVDISNGKVSVAGLIVAAHTPSTAADTGVAGTVAWDSNYIYICTATNTWKRAALSSW